MASNQKKQKAKQRREKRKEKSSRSASSPVVSSQQTANTERTRVEFALVMLRHIYRGNRYDINEYACPGFVIAAELEDSVLSVLAWPYRQLSDWAFECMVRMKVSLGFTVTVTGTDARAIEQAMCGRETCSERITLIPSQPFVIHPDADVTRILHDIEGIETEYFGALEEQIPDEDWQRLVDYFNEHVNIDFPYPGDG